MTGVPDPLATPLPGGLVLLGPGGVRLLLWSMLAAEQVSRRDGIRAPAQFLALRSLLEHAAQRQASSSASGRSEVPPPPDRASSSASTSSVTWVDPIGTSEAAQLLSCTARNVRDLCVRGVFETAGVRASRWWVEKGEVSSRAARVRPRRCHLAPDE